MMSLAPSWRTSSSGRHSTLIPHARSVSAIARAFDRAASIAEEGASAIKLGEALGGGKRRPRGRPHPRHSPALLIDQDRQIGAAGQIAQRIGQPQELLGIVAIALGTG